MRPIALPLTLAALLALSACGTVASDAPALLSGPEIAARTAGAADSARGQQAADELAWRAQNLRARAAQLRRAGTTTTAEDEELLRRARALQAQQG
ncbi:hypothetical protein [Pararhodobacter sp. CCB-MM2]|uniref:hypothetical protein n=1 Tax=Pararhodobacter sp. CCB-MM2 TaxID=1786003 RepID=UPI000831E83A|nr:hypothetical protein [Pararhodobacter sp. CCB-MM2]